MFFKSVIRPLRSRAIVCLCLIPAIALSGCADPADFAKPISDFSDAMTAATTAIQALDTTSASRLTALRSAEGATFPRRVRVKDGECLTNSSACTIVILSRPDDPAPRPVNVKAVIPNSVAVMAALQAYAKALDGMVTADASADLKAGLSKAAAAAALIAPAAGLPSTVVTAVAQPVIDTISWLFVQYQNSVKLEALRKATAAANPDIARAMALLGTEVDIGKIAAAAQLEQEVNAKYAIINGLDNPTSQQMADLVAAASLLDAALSLKPGAVFAKIATAHQKLTDALANPKVSFDDAVAAVQSLAVEVGNLQALSAQLHAATAPASPAK